MKIEVNKNHKVINKKSDKQKITIKIKNYNSFQTKNIVFKKTTFNHKIKFQKSKMSQVVVNLAKIN